MQPTDKIDIIKMKNEQKEIRLMHYYGDEVRTVFLVMAVAMMFVTPFVKEELPVPAFFSVFGVIALAVLAGFTNPKTKPVIVLNFITSLGSLAIFSNEIINSYGFPHTALFFWSNVGLAMLSLFAAYYSSKTLRGLFSA